MNRQWHDEMDRAIDLGLIDVEDCDRLVDEAQRLGLSPAQILLQEGLISEQTLGRLQMPFSKSKEVETGALTGPYIGIDGDFPQSPRFTKKRLLGQGGMSKVYLAWDNQLEREVAIKVFPRDSKYSHYMLREAQAQARLHHDRICKVFEVGETETIGFIVMEFIDGFTLGEASKQMTRPQLLECLRQVAEGIDKVHALGLIHRDIKPGNILVRRENDQFTPYVLDFGLAHDWTDEVLTSVAAGTPAFMAPEQALGQMGCLDPRTDVYGLGATLYWCLAGRPPITGSNGLDVLARIPHEEPSREALIERKTSRELISIVMKCLEKNRARRYGSAAALAEDLERYLSGRPVLAHDPTLPYRMVKLVRRNKLWSVLLLTLFLAGAGLALNTLHMRRVAEERTAVITRMTRRAEEIEALARYMAMAPLHDVRPERERLARMLDTIEREHLGDDPVVLGARNYALGRGYMSLGDATTARGFLTDAWNAGVREPGCAYALAQALGVLYREALDELATANNEAHRKAIRERARADFRDPALSYLHHSGEEASRFPWYVEALIAYYEERHDDALEILTSAEDRPSWFYDALVLEGHIHTGVLLSRPSSEAGRKQAYEKGLAAFAEARKVASSDPVPLLAEAKLHRFMLRRAVMENGDAAPYFEAGMAALDQALAIDEKHPDALLLKMTFYNLMSESEVRLGRGEEYLDQAIRLAESLGYYLNPKFQQVLAETYLSIGYRQLQAGADITDSLNLAITQLELVPKANRDFTWYFRYALAFKLRADYRQTRGLNNMADRAWAIENYHRALNINPHMIEAYYNMGGELLLLAQDTPVERRHEAFEEAIEVFSKARELDPRSFFPSFYLAQCYQGMAVLAWGRGEDPESYFDQALQSYEAAAAINNRVPNFYQGMAVVWLERIVYYAYLGLPLGDAASQAEAAADQSLTLYPKDGLTHLTLANVFLRQGWQSARLGLDPETALARCDVHVAKARSFLPHPRKANGVALSAALARATAALQRNADPGPWLAEAEDMLEQARNTGTGYGHHHLVGIYHTLASLLAEDGTGHWEAACGAYRRALNDEPENHVIRIDLARHLCLQAIGEPKQAAGLLARAAEQLASIPGRLSPEAERLWLWLDEWRERGVPETTTRQAAFKHSL